MTTTEDVSTTAPDPAPAPEPAQSARTPEPRRSVAPKALGDALRGHSNSLGLIRLVLAALVIFDHSFVLGGFEHDNPVLALTRGQATIGSLAVAGFFTISGYLIAKSGMNADIIQFLWRRFLRIFPAYWVVLILAAVVVGPIFWQLEGNALQDYFTNAPNGPLAYLLGDWTLQVNNYGIYDIFAGTTPYGQLAGGVLNGSIWTLYYEWLCYMIIAVLVVFGILTRARLVVPLLTGLFFALQLVETMSPGTIANVIPVVGDPQILKLALTFLCGSCLAVYSKQVPYDFRIALFALTVAVLTLRWGGFDLVGPFALAYFFLWLAAWLPKPFQVIGAKNDYSYGVYIYGFLVQQMLAFFGVYRLGYLPYALSALVGSLLLAWLSWHVVEKNAMALKDWGPGRGMRYWYGKVRPKRAAAEPL